PKTYLDIGKLVATLPSDTPRDIGHAWKALGKFPIKDTEEYNSKVREYCTNFKGTDNTNTQSFDPRMERYQIKRSIRNTKEPLELATSRGDTKAIDDNESKLVLLGAAIAFLEENFDISGWTNYGEEKARQ